MFIDYDTLFCFVDDLCKSFEPWYQKKLIADGFLNAAVKNLLNL
jgi:hypothetical protein